MNIYKSNDFTCSLCNEAWEYPPKQQAEKRLNPPNILRLEPLEMAVVLIHEKKPPHPILEKIPRNTTQGNPSKHRLEEQNPKLEAIDLVLVATGTIAAGEVDAEGRGDDAKKKKGEAREDEGKGG